MMTGWLLNRYTRSEVLHKTTACNGQERSAMNTLFLSASFRSVSFHGTSRVPVSAR